MSSSAVLTGVRRLRFLLAGQHGREQSDEQLLTAFTDHRDESAFAALVHRHGPMVLGVCRRILGHEQDAEDALQAVFLVLARRAASLRNKSALPSFLHGTAYHLASKAKRAAGRRRKHEGSLGTLTQPRPSADPPDALLWREVRAALDEEIARLPEKYRSVFVLCCLEELSQAEAGRRLGLKEGTTANRLAQARKLLAQRLARRGVELTAALAASLLAVPPASALPAELTATTIKAALAAAAGKQWAGIVSASVAKLVHGAPATMLVSKAKMAAAVLLLVVTSSSLVGWFGRASGPLAGTTEPPAAKVDDKPRAVPPKREAAKTVAVQGRVFGPDGKPKQGAELLLLSADGEIKPLGATAADGCFTVSIPKAMPLPWLIAQTQNAGIDFLNVDQLESGKSVELRLVKDQPIRGRVVNTEGQPIRGARVTVRGISVYPNELLDSLRADWKKGHFQREFPNSKKRLWPKAAALLPTRTDADGRFALHGIGEDWLVRLRIRGVGIADTEWSIVNDNYFDPKPSKPVSTLAITGNDMVLVESREARHGPKVAIVASAEKPIRGVVKDADTGKGRPGVEVLLNRIEPENGKGRFLVAPLVKARTDERGRYELHGVRKGKSYLLEVLSDTAAGYLRCQVIVADTPGHQPITADIPVKKGVIVTGTLRACLKSGN